MWVQLHVPTCAVSLQQDGALIASCSLLAGHRQFWCHCPAPRSPLWSPRSNRLAAALWRQRHPGSHRHRSLACSLCCSQRRLPFTATSPGTLSKVRGIPFLCVCVCVCACLQVQVQGRGGGREGSTVFILCSFVFVAWVRIARGTWAFWPSIYA